MLLAISIVAALYRCQKTGEGERISLAMQDAMLHYIRVALSVSAVSGKPAPRVGSGMISGTNVPGGIFPCAPGGSNDYVYVYTAKSNPAHWHSLLKVIGRDDLIGDPRFETGDARVERQTEVEAMISGWTMQRDKHEAMRLLGAAGIPAGAVLDTAELLADPDFARRGIMQAIQHPTVGELKMPTWPVRHSGAPPTVEPAPLLGQHTAEVLSHWLQLDAKAVAALHQDGVV